MLNLREMGILLDNQTGQLSYASTFKPMLLNVDLVFVRHGETFGNCGQVTQDAKIDAALVSAGVKNHKLRIFQGDVDTDINQLTEYGRVQAENLAGKLDAELLKNGWIPDFIFHSPLSRARETGLPFVRRNNFKDRYIELDIIREMSFGSWENKRVCDMKPDDQCHLFYMQQNVLVKESGINGNGNYQHSENFLDVIVRAYTALKQVNRNYNKKKIIMFSHSMFGAACCILLGKGQQHECGNYLAFDGNKSNGQPYTIPNATPFFLNMTDGS